LVVFVDVTGSTQLYEELGDIAAYTKISTCLAQLGDIVARFGGIVIKHIGDEVLCFFADVVAGVRAVIVAQIEMHTASAQHAMPVRIGCHYGDILWRDRDIFGDTVNIAAHLASLAKAGQILSTDSTLNQYESARISYQGTYQIHGELDFERRLNHRLLTQFMPKGKQNAIHVELVQWEIFLDEIVTDWTFVKPILHVEQQLALRLLGFNAVHVLNSEAPRLSVGRTQDVTVMINSRNVSRIHGVFELIAGQIKYTDRSSNGSYIRIGQQKSQLVHCGTVNLAQDGAISFGAHFSDPQALVFTFEVESSSTEG